jgi:thiamine biosynthesis lipoprotein
MQRLEVLNGWVRVDRPAMGSTARLLAYGVDAAVVLDAAIELDRLEGLWSRFRAGSDVTRINAAAGRRAVAVSPDTIALVERACALWRETGGRFDPTILRALERHGYDRSFEHVRARRLFFVSGPAGHPTLTIDAERGLRAAIGAICPAPGCGGIVVDDRAGTVALPEGVSIDLGGVGKGFAADVVTERLMREGAVAACVGMGGDVRCRGVGPDDGSWDIGVEDPFDVTRTLLTVRLQASAVVTSTTRIRRWVQGDRVRHHLIDPSTGEPTANGIAAAIVAADDAWRAEGMAKAAIVAGRDDGLALLDSAGLAALIVDDQGRGHLTARTLEGTFA